MMKVTPRLSLTLRAPETAPVDQPVTMRVTDPDGQGVSGAAMFVIPLRNTSDITSAYSDIDQLVRDAEACAEILDDPAAEAELAAGSEAQERIVRMRGYLKGFTDRDGYFGYSFPQAGPHLLIAAKCGYVPDFKKIYINGSQLNLRAPDSAPVCEPVEMRVTDSTGQGINHAAIFAVPLLSTTDGSVTNGNYEQLFKEAEAYAQMLERPTVNSSLPVNEECKDSIWNIRCHHVGFTDRDGYFRYSFPQTGPYLLIAAKCGYVPDFHIIKITKCQPLPAEPAPMNIQQVDEVKISLKK
jgi:hypothetical protein